MVWIPRRERGIAMKSDPMSKLSASLVVLLMALSAMVIVPAGIEGQSSSAKNIYVPVLSGGSPVTNAYVNLTDVHTGAVIAADYMPSKAAYAVEGAPSGYFRVDVTHSDYYDKLDASEFRFDATSNYTTSVVQLTGFPTKQYVWNITVRDPANLIVVGALVGFYDPIAKEFVAKGTTNELGWASVSMFRTTVLGDVDLVIVKKGFETYVEQVIVSGDVPTRTINLVQSKIVSSYVTLGSETVSNVVAYLINTDSSIPWVKRVLKSSSAAMSFDAYAGDYVLVVDGDGASAHVQTLTVSTTDVDLTISLSAQTQRTEMIDITYGADFRTFSLNVNTTWSYDDAYPGLMYTDMGSLRMQVDLTMGNGDGTLSPTEANDFKALIQTYGSQYVTSDKLLTVNDTAYLSNVTVEDYVNGLASGSVVNVTGVNYSYSCGYTASAMDVNALAYDSIVSVNYDTSSVDYEYTIALVSTFERVSNSSFGGTIAGYTTVAIDPSTGSGSWVSIAMGIQKSETPSASAGITPEENVAYAVYDDKNITAYIVRVDANVTFNAGSSIDPNGNPMNYTWKFGDGSLDVTTSNKTVVHKYLTAAAERTVNLTIIDAAGLPNWTDLKVVCDNLDPSPVIWAKNRTLNTTDNSVAIEQREMLIVNGKNSTDDVATLGDGLGTVSWVQFEYGDGNSSDRIAWNETDQNATHSYANSGTYTLVLNVMDVVGHSKNTTLTVKVNDTTKPTVTYTAKNETGGSNLVENRTVVFDASSSFDNLDNISLLRFEWNYGDGVWENFTGLAGTNVTHNYTHVTAFHVALNVTDVAGNWQKAPKTINILEGPRPKMKVERVYYSPGNFSEGKQGYILVNLTNTGSRPASGVVVTFWVVRTDGTESLLGTAMSSGGQMYNGSLSVTVVEVGGKVQIKFPASFGTKGTYTIKVNVTCTDQLSVARYTASGDQALIVKEAGWKKPLLWGGVAAVIILVPLALYFRGRLSKREKKGPRREKKSEEGQ